MLQTGTLLGKVAECIGDPDKAVRAALKELLSNAILPQLKGVMLGPFVPLVMAHLFSALTSLSEPVRSAPFQSCLWLFWSLLQSPFLCYTALRLQKLQPLSLSTYFVCSQACINTGTKQDRGLGGLGQHAVTKCTSPLASSRLVALLRACSDLRYHKQMPPECLVLRPTITSLKSYHYLAAWPSNLGPSATVILA